MLNNTQGAINGCTRSAVYRTPTSNACALCSKLTCMSLSLGPVLVCGSCCWLSCNLGHTPPLFPAPTYSQFTPPASARDQPALASLQQQLISAKQFAWKARTIFLVQARSVSLVTTTFISIQSSHACLVCIEV